MTNPATYQARIHAERESGVQRLAEAIKPHALVTLRHDLIPVLTARDKSGKLVAVELDLATHATLMVDLFDMWEERTR